MAPGWNAPDMRKQSVASDIAVQRLSLKGLNNLIELMPNHCDLSAYGRGLARVGRQAMPSQLRSHPPYELLAVRRHEALVQWRLQQAAEHEVVEAMHRPVVLRHVDGLEVQLAPVPEALLQVLDGQRVLIVEFDHEVEEGPALLLELLVRVALPPCSTGKQQGQYLFGVRGVLRGVGDQRVCRVGHDGEAYVREEHEEQRGVCLALCDPRE
mmetsp:Transcript_102579/g.285828  ORF Transcript_102579/g.285828 Transcript_102579/m.285828 type:complete len:211 (-) Transcript_102579:958-1590(-)